MPPFFDLYWTYREAESKPDTGILHRVGRADLTLPCPGGYISIRGADQGRTALDIVMSEMGFDPDKQASSESCLSYTDRDNRRAQPLIRITLQFPPVRLHFSVIHRIVDLWHSGPAYNPGDTVYLD